MNNIEKLAGLFDADLHLLDINSNEVKVLYQQDDSSNVNIPQILKKKSTLFYQHRYTSIDYALGYIIISKVNQSKFVCLSFSYEKQTLSTNELTVLQSLHNLKLIAQIIYSMYNGLSAPDEELFITNSYRSNQKHQQNENEFDAQLYFQVETEIVKAIIYSERTQLVASLDKLFKLKILPCNLLSSNTIRNEKNGLIAFISILNRAIIQWGYPSNKAFKMQFDLTREIELSPQFSNFPQTIKRISWFYFTTIKNYRFNNYLPLHQRIRQYIKQNIRKNIALNDIASGLNASKKTLNPAFKQEYGMTIVQFIRTAKIETAKELIIASNLSLQEISDVLAFSSVTYFVKTFKKVTGLTPSTFRNQFINSALKH